MNSETMQLFKTLTEYQAAPGFERGLRKFVKQELKEVSDEIIQDRLGSIFGVKSGDKDGPKVMVAGHMDEVGFMVASITDNGMLRFNPLGGWSNQVLLAQRVQVMTEQGPIIGVIGSTPPHLLSDAEKSKILDIKHMYIDVGGDDRKDVEENMGIHPGQQVVPVCPFTPMANSKKLMAKAWDNRYGVGLSIELLRALKNESIPNVLYSGATVQEEVGLRGAQTAAQMINPDIFFALDASPANDMSGDKQAFGQLGKGTLLRILDRTMVTHRGMIEYVKDMAATHHIPYQYFISQGGTDAGKVHLTGRGIPSAVIGICSRYIHTSASIIHTDDYDAAKELIIKLVKNLDQTTFQTIIENA